ncbi:1,4-dihydroxy-2-naphthoate polyprenyltransferase [Vibrio ostreicida]|uniref:1,4-dihydroxy-2-naphthoate octaprenyltransferase n=1 Tax=Vibrio ostreicida TaxID=526588 RepID=A0ABT8BQ49_9VIBR|nr:1,4-dihydroxy-2-naphthoate polyprenyltransferase [Vibrio ostreicida]MDN3608390.1 1,4-dihydroxy-2-naphthoate polyprenyltransferase [Vibrio ostreicida]NPD10212.1 1,4-dihydroxy-2-naphthoate polyprenyltransferase [Vibrio ostreicida]
MKHFLRIWFDAARPNTLPLALVSILTGSVLAYSSGQFSILISVLALTTATLLQIVSNLANDYGDAIKGTDNHARLGPVRAIQSGLVSQSHVRWAILLSIMLTLASGLTLVLYALDSLHNILVFIGLGILSIIAAVAYTVGQKPYGYLGLGDVSVFVFFGLLGVAGTYFLHTGVVALLLVLPSIGCGLMAVAVLNINNMRDIENDEQCGKRTVAVRLGQKMAKQYHAILLAVALVAFILYLLLQPVSFWVSLPFFVSIIMVYRHGKAVWQTERPAQIAPMMSVIVKCSLITNLLFAGVVIAQILVS